MTRTFIITLNFEKQWSAMGLNDDNLRELEKGKSSGARVMYVDFAVYDQWKFARR